MDVIESALSFWALQIICPAHIYLYIIRLAADAKKALFCHESEVNANINSHHGQANEGEWTESMASSRINWAAIACSYLLYIRELIRRRPSPVGQDKIDGIETESWSPLS